MVIKWLSKHPRLLGKESEVIETYLKIKKISKVSKEYNVGDAAIYAILERNNVPVTRRKSKYNLSPETIKDILDSYVSGIGTYTISNKHNIDQCVVARIITENNITLRDKKSHLEFKHITTKIFKETIISRYGGWTELISRYRDNFEKKYGEGIVNPMQVEEYFNRQKENSLKIKKATINGKEFRYMGYELKAIDKLMSEGYVVDDIKIGKGNVPNFIYEINGKKHRYYPDIYIPKDNRIVEVKSSYIMELEYDINMVKQQCVKDAGYIFDFMIF